MRRAYIPLTLALAMLIPSPLLASPDSAPAKSVPRAETTQIPTYSTGGFAEVVIERPIAECFAVLTDVSRWPKINVGVTKAVTPKDVVLAAGTTFNESIASPIPGIKDWSNTWTVEKFEPGKTFVISGRENFASAPIHSRITYQFSQRTPTSTVFRRSIEVSLDDAFASKATKPELEALYRFLGSHWEMARHLKTYVEADAAIGDGGK